jgi:hypothetical protein
MASPVGKHKAIVFERVLGITRDHSSFLFRQIEEKAPLSDWLFQKEDKWGKRYTVDILVEGINGATANVRTGWIVDQQHGPARMTTIFILERGR